MADRISELPELAATPAVDDLLAITDVSDPGTGTTKKITTTNLFAYLPDLTGWTPVAVAWAYASATTITVPAGADTIYSVGDKIRFKQGGAYKYYYIITVAAALLTVTGGSDYTVANAAITNIYYSKNSSPVGFPGWFNCAVGYTGFSANPTATIKFSISGRTFFFNYVTTGAGTSNAVTFTLTGLPVAAVILAFGATNVKDNGAWQAGAGSVYINGTTMTLGKTMTGAGGFTASGDKDTSFELFYEI